MAVSAADLNYSSSNIVPSIVTYHESYPVSDIHLKWKNLTVKAKVTRRRQFFKRLEYGKPVQTEEKFLLHNLSGIINGGLWAIMGPSGSGKSTLLNTLACRLDKNTIFEGQLLINGTIYNNGELKKIAGYVMQDDLLNGQLTIEETLIYIAELRLPRTWTKQGRQNRVDHVLSQMNLNDVRQQIIGSSIRQGISGSERKRLCLGIQLLTCPQILFLDEPTTGLDSVTAFDLLQILYLLTRTNIEAQHAITVVCSIHQPQFKIFELFDNVLLLHSGRTVYQGPRNEVIKTFQKAGFPCPLFTNPADHLLDVITSMKMSSPMGRQNEVTCTIQSSFNDTDVNKKHIDHDVERKYILLHSKWFREVQILFSRNIRELSRGSYIILVSLFQSIIMAVLIGSAFYQVGNSQASIFRRESVLFSCIVNQCLFNALMIINSFPIERTLVLRERACGTYHASTYLIAKILTDTLRQLPGPIAFSCTVYFMVGFQATTGRFLLFMLFIILCSITSASVALMVSALCKTTQMSLTILPMILEVSRLFGGFLLAPSHIPKYFVWLDIFSYFKYTYIGLSINELHNLSLVCVNSSRACIPNGQILIENRGFDYINIPACIGILLGFILFTRIITYLAIRFLKQ